MIWPVFCSALIVGRLAPLGLHNTRFRSVPLSCSPRTGADASSPRHETRRNVADSGSLGSRKGLRRRTSPVLYAPSAPSAMALPHGSPAVRPGEACRIPRPRWRTRGRCAARHGRNGARDRPRRHARRPMIPPVPAPAAPAPWCPWRRRTPGRRSRGRARRRRTPCSQSVRDLLRLHRLHSASALDHLRMRLTRLIDLRQRTLTTGLRISRRPRIVITPRDHPTGDTTGQRDHAHASNQRHQPTRTTPHNLVLNTVLAHRTILLARHPLSSPPRHRHGPVRSRPREAAERSETAHNVRARNTQG